jgi:hypothetical protein
MRTIPLVLITFVALSLSPTAARAGANGSYANCGTGLDGSINLSYSARASCAFCTSRFIEWLSTRCRVDPVSCRLGRSDLVLPMRGLLLRHYHPVSLEAARGHVIINGSGQEGAIAGRPTHDHWTNSPQLRTHTTRYSPVIAPLSSIN